ncbi:helical membrane plugin domain-containing protein [Neobacillus ginsengisoli]|uniref:Uncharacterized protein YjgD (DUF1641 family) n=1 Tax=Neobacillus ginsengisoli TaxID=904295 RepID=A0ABT9XY08_9BACI|nr:DUF1641 domain-containing protein [Neobacillus ginsengisoli]MDQ0200145.1 uncharacterized protein YjgD (DUF1641 family) [Neobacillus ginsengisoli]
MAQPITIIKKEIPTVEEQAEQKLASLKMLLTENEDALNKIMDIVGELHQSGVLEAANAMLQTKEDIAKIALHQVNREPVTNFINNFLGASVAFTNFKPEQTTKLVSSVASGIDEGNKYVQSNKKVGILDLMKVLNDPDINRAIGFGIHFLKGMGKSLKEE